MNAKNVKTSESTQEVETTPMVDNPKPETLPEYLNRVEREAQEAQARIAALHAKGMQVVNTLPALGKADCIVLVREGFRTNIHLSETVSGLTDDTDKVVNIRPQIVKVIIDLLTSAKNLDTKVPVSVIGLNELKAKGYSICWASWHYGPISWTYSPSTPVSITDLESEINHNAMVVSRFIQTGEIVRTKSGKTSPVDTGMKE